MRAKIGLVIATGEEDEESKDEEKEIDDPVKSRP
jgi:hypothetical protein